VKDAFTPLTLAAAEENVAEHDVVELELVGRD
jgi:hypothetical protein